MSAISKEHSDLASEIARYADESQLTAALDEVVTSRRLKAVAVGIYNAGKLSFGCATHASYRDNMFSNATRVHSGCISKCLTAMLVAHAVYEGKFELHDNVWQLLGAVLSPNHKERLSTTSIRHLLNHTHGLDDSRLESMPRLSNGFCDAENLCSALLGVPALAPSGVLFSYSNAGVWLAAAILEFSYGLPYAQILQDKLLQQIENSRSVRMESNTKNSGIESICPATGDNLKLSTSDLLGIACCYLSGASESQRLPMALAKSFGSLLEDPLVPIVWKPKAREICLGWNDYGGGWYGHNAKFRGDSIVLRFCQEKQIAIAIVARQEHAAYVTLGSLFGRHLDEFCAMYVPKQLTAEEWTKVDASCFIGRFENAAMAYLVDMAADKALKVGVHQKSSPTITTNEPLIKRRLRAAADQVFYSVPADHALLPFVQFFGLADGKYQYLFSNQQIFPRIR